MMKKLTTENFSTEIKSGLKLVEFFAPWCMYCKKQEEVLKELDKIWIGQINTDEDAELAIRFSVHAFPTFLIFKDGKEMERFSGLRTKLDLMNILNKWIK